ncbi:MAG: hypothetical protein WBB29_09150 [Geitlerinemataceae cyanobacterium]
MEKSLDLKGRDDTSHYIIEIGSIARLSGRSIFGGYGKVHSAMANSNIIRLTIALL